jgi:hypothetical protein
MKKTKTKKNKKTVSKTKNTKTVKKQPRAKVKKTKVAPKKKPVEKVVQPKVDNSASTTELEIKRAKHDRVKALEGAVAKPTVSQFELNALILKLAGEVKKRGRNKNQIKFKKLRAAFDRYN